MFLEVIAKDINDIKEINKSNADRIEFCNYLEVGGLTPELEDIKYAAAFSKLPLNVIVRNIESFYPDENEQRKMLNQIKLIASDTKANGIVIGVLNQDNSINENFLKRVNLVKGNLEVTFHRAFNHVNDLQKALMILDKYNVNNVLTTGDDNVNLGFKKLASINLAKYKVKVLLGGGIEMGNISKALSISKHIHIGRFARKNSKWESSIDIDKINNFKTLE